MIKLIDMHSHSNFSIDSKNTIELSCESSIEKGLGGFAITDHLDSNPKEWGYGYYDPTGYFEAYQAMKKKYGDRIKILAGVEFSESHIYYDALDKISSYPYDVILGSVHWIDAGYIGNSEILSYMPQLEVERRYFEAIKKVIAHGKIDVLAHLDIPKRAFGKRVIDPGVITDLLKDLVQSGIALEINTSALRQGLDESLPEFAVVEEFVRLGGKKITLGSDAHRSEDLAADFITVLKALSEQTRRCVGYFEKRQFVSYWEDESKYLSVLLMKYDKRFPNESESVSVFSHFINGSWTELDEFQNRGHLTGSAWIVNADRTKVLLTHHKRLDRWFQLGGHVEISENVFEAANREALEESGLSSVKPLDGQIFDIDAHVIPMRPGVPAHTHFDVRFLFEADEIEPILISDESNDVRWVPVSEISQYSTDESVLRMVRKMKTAL